MPKHPLYSSHGRNKRHGVTNEQSNARSDRRPGRDDVCRIRKQSGRQCDRANRAVVLLREPGSVSWFADLPGQLRKELSCQILAASLQIGLHPPIAHPLRGAAQC
jgi:hypothetical protein